MPYTPTVWTDEVPDTTPVKYKISQATDGDVATDATIEIVTDVTAGTPVNAANLNHIEEALDELVDVVEALPSTATILNLVYPIGCIYESTVATNPNTVFGFGTWAAFGAGQVIVGVGTSDAVYAAGATGGESSHILTTPEIPAHTHTQNTHNHSVTEGADYQHISFGTDAWVAGVTSRNTSNTVAVNQNAGGGGAHNNMPPFTVAYRWKRTA